MASEAPSWADQWGAGGIGAMADGNSSTDNQEANSKNKTGDGKTGLNKAKTAATLGAQKIKSGASNSFKWVKAKCQRKSDTK